MALIEVTPRRSIPRSIRPARLRSPSALGQGDGLDRTDLSSEPPRKRRRYIPGGPGGGGRYLDGNGREVPVGGTGPGGYNYIGPRGPVGRENAANGVQPMVYPVRRDRSARTRTRTRTRTVAPRADQPHMRFRSAAQAAAVVQSDGYKPREERAWEEFHDNLDIEGILRSFNTPDVEGVVNSRQTTPAASSQAPGDPAPSINGSVTPKGLEGERSKSEGRNTPTSSVNGDHPPMLMGIPGTPGGGKRRPGRPPKNPIDFYTRRAAALGKGLNVGTPKTPMPVPLQNMSAKEKLTLPQPSYRKTNTLSRFDDKSLGYGKYVDKSMQNVGYQESDEYFRPAVIYIKADDGNNEEDLDLAPAHKGAGETVITLGSGGVGRVEYDMDEQDDRWLQSYNAERKAAGFEELSREVLEITLTKIEKEWHALEKRIPKPNPKPPQTHRPRSGSAAAVNGEPQSGEEQDSRCAICDDGDCENTNAIVFCDGCDLAVHQECYGVPFIPEGQWLCRKCQLIGRGIPTCIFCPNTDGAFKQTNASKWAHLLCAMWIPEVALGNHTFMEPVMEVEKVPRTRWKLRCYLCQQQMGACIQCGNKNCYQAFHVTCARKARLFLKMKNNHGTLAVLDGSTVLKAFCDKHCPPDWARENDVAGATRDALQFYRRTMRGRLWADSQASALALAATHRHAITEHQPDESQLTGAKVTQVLDDSKRRGNEPTKSIWKLPSGAPVIPQAVYNSVESSIQRFNIRKRKEFAADACRYWTLKREARRGAALLKRLQLSMETFSSMELTRRNFSGMGPTGLQKLNRRIEFAQTLVEDLDHLKELTSAVVQREGLKLQQAKHDEDFVGTVYFPLVKFLAPILERAAILDTKNTFIDGLTKLQAKVENLFYTSAIAFARDLAAVFSTALAVEASNTEVVDIDMTVASKKAALDLKDRKRMIRKIIKAVQPALTEAVRGEADICNKPANEQIIELEAILDTGLEPRRVTGAFMTTEEGQAELDTDMPDASPTKNYSRTRMLEKTGQQSGPADVTMLDAKPNTTTMAAQSPMKEDEVLIVVNDVTNQITTNYATASKFTNTPPDTNGDTNENGSKSEKNQPGPPTPPISNGELTATYSATDVLASGGLLWYVKDFQPEGTKALEENPPDPDADSMSEELSDMDEEELNGLGVEFENSTIGNPVVPVMGATTVPAAKKKPKARKRRRW